MGLMAARRRVSAANAKKIEKQQEAPKVEESKKGKKPKE